MLIKNEAEVNVHGYCDETPLHDAAFNGHPKVTSLIINKNKYSYKPFMELSLDTIL